MRARDIMSAPAAAIRPGEAVKTAENLAAQRGFSALPVVDEDHRVIGIVTEGDFVADRFPAEPQRPGRTVADIMTSPAKTVDINDNATLVARLMVDERIRCVPVIDRGELAGVVTRRDFLRVLARPDQALANDIRARLAVFGDEDRWLVDVRDGDATIVDRFDSTQDRDVAVILAEGVPGVIRARCYVGESEPQQERA